MTTEFTDPIERGAIAYEEWRAELLAGPGMREKYAEEETKLDLWLQLVRARKEAGLTQMAMSKRLGVSQAQIARIEKRGYDAYALNTLRRYVEALGAGFELEVTIRHVPAKENKSREPVPALASP